VHSINDLYKRQELAKDLLKYGIDVCCIQETKIQEDLDGNVGEYRLLSFNGGSHHGLGFYIRREFEKRFTVANVRREENKDRIASLHLRTIDGKRFTIINVHAPTAEKSEQDHYDFQSALDSTYRKYSSNQLCLICGDFNAEVGRKQMEDTCVGNHTTDRDRSEQGVQLVDFCERHNLFLCNTGFAQSATHYGTTGTTTGTYLRQIDYVICPRKLKGMLTNCRTHAKTVISDHRLLAARLNLSRFYGMTGAKTKPKCKTVKYDLETEYSGNT